MKTSPTPLLALALIGALAFPARADTYSSNPISFNTAPISFNSSPLGFTSSPLAFTSTQMLTETSTTVEVTLPADIVFDFDKADIRAEAQTALHELATLIREKARGPVAIRGYTDGLGKDAYNQTLSEKRAASIKTWLVKREGLGATTFSTAGFGAHDPVAPNKNPDGSDNPEGRQLNRRVTLIIRK